MKSGLIAKSLSGSVVLAALLLVSCKPMPQTEPSNVSSEGQWRRSPALVGAVWNGRNVSLSGMAEANSRVVLEDGGGRIYAVNSDSDGRFSIDLSVPDGGLYLKPRAQYGQSFIDGQGRVFLMYAERPLAVALTDGQPSYNLIDNGPLDAVDSDGVVTIISGQAVGGAVPILTVDGKPMTVQPNQSGQWAVVFQGGTNGFALQIDDAAYRYPGNSVSESGVTKSGQGWLISREIGGKAVQTTWIPEHK